MENEKNIQEIIREIIEELIQESTIEIDEVALKEIDLVSKTKSDWTIAKKDLKKTIEKLIKNIETDDYKEGVELIDKAIEGLKLWKQKINKNI